jgi:2-polyprenyl-6-methoxyphenol hydroxylase-like FAD-dependent oxidoreductase
VTASSAGTQTRLTRRAIVIGGSIAGLFVAAFLRRVGWQVDIYERSSVELIGRGVGIFASHLELFEALDKCGAGTVDIGVIVYKRITLDRSGDVIAEKPFRSSHRGIDCGRCC